MHNKKLRILKRLRTRSFLFFIFISLHIGHMEGLRLVKRQILLYLLLLNE